MGATPFGAVRFGAVRFGACSNDQSHGASRGRSSVMKRKLLTLSLAALASIGVSAALAASAAHHRHDHGYRHVSRAHHHAIRPGFAFTPPAARNWGGCVTDDGQ